MGQQDNEKVSAPTAEQLDFFEKRIRPVLVQHCYNCHSKKAAAKDELRGGLLLDSRVGFLAGGDSGADGPKHSAGAAARAPDGHLPPLWRGGWLWPQCRRFSEASM